MIKPLPRMTTRKQRESVSERAEKSMNILDLSFWQGSLRLLGTLAILIGGGAWMMEFAGTVYICPYCRVQRTVIMLLGLMMILPFAHHWVSQYVSSVIGFLGAVVAVNQNFMGWVKISKGAFTFADLIYIVSDSLRAHCSSSSASLGSS